MCTYQEGKAVSPNKGAENFTHRSGLEFHQSNLHSTSNRPEICLGIGLTCITPAGTRSDCGANTSNLPQYAETQHVDVSLSLGLAQGARHNSPARQWTSFLCRRHSIVIRYYHSIRAMVLLYQCWCKEPIQHSRQRTVYSISCKAYARLHLSGKREDEGFPSEATTTLGLGS